MTNIDLSSLWQAVLGELEVNISKANYRTWLENTNLLELEEGKAIVAVPNVFTREWIEKKYHPQIFEVCAKQIDNLCQIEYRVSTCAQQSVDNITLKTVDKINEENSLDSLSKNTEELAPKILQPSSTDNPLAKKYSFENFVVGSSNHLAFAASKLVSEKPGDHYNPLFIYGPAGVGKTHLMWAINTSLKQNRPDAKTVYIPCEDFTNEFIRAIREGNTRQFTDKYRKVDLLLVDDLQFLAGKDKTQEEFFHTFNALHQANKQIVLCSDRSPKEIPTLEDRLRSRFEWGMVADISAPDFETRVAILSKKAQNRGLNLEDEVLNFVAEKFESNIRELEGSLTKIVAFCEIHDVSPTVEIVESILGIQNQPVKIEAKDIIIKVANHFNIKSSDLLGAKRDKQIVLPRQMAMYLMRNELDMSFPQIASNLGGRDHTTIMYGVKKINDLTKSNQSLDLELKTLKQKIF